MKRYTKILLAVAFDEKSDAEPISRALEMAKTFNADLYLMHSVEQISNYGAAYGVGVGADIEEVLLNNAKEAMVELGNKIGVPQARQVVRIGSAKRIILEEAEEIGADLIVLGSHGYHGIRLFLGSTANAVLHGATCDVLAVRLKGD